MTRPADHHGHTRSYYASGKVTIASRLGSGRRPARQPDVTVNHSTLAVTLKRRVAAL
jgi:hypothetical protein